MRTYLTSLIQIYFSLLELECIFKVLMTELMSIEIKSNWKCTLNEMEAIARANGLYITYQANALKLVWRNVNTAAGIIAAYMYVFFNEKHSL